MILEAVTGTDSYFHIKIVVFKWVKLHVEWDSLYVSK